MAEVHRLQSCRRCRHLFVAVPGQRLCPDCLTAVRRERARRNLLGAASQWRPLLVFAVGTLATGLLAFSLHPAWTHFAVWLGGILALVYIARTS